MKYIFFLVVIVLVAIFGLGFSLSPQKSQPVPAALSGTSATGQNTNANTSGRYMAYTKDNFDAAAGRRRILYFHADWCPTCRPLDRELSENTAAIPEDVVIFKANYDTESALKKKHSVTYQHTFVQVDAEGTEVTKWSGGTLADILKNIR